MAATLVATFTLIRLFEDHYMEISVILFCWFVLLKPWIANMKLKILRTFTWLVKENMALQLTIYYVSSHASACYSSIRHGGVIGPLWLAHQWQYWFPRLATGRSGWIALTVIYYLIRSFVYLVKISSINSSYIAIHVTRCKNRENFWITFIREISTVKTLVQCLTKREVPGIPVYPICFYKVSYIISKWFFLKTALHRYTVCWYM